MRRINLSHNLRHIHTLLVHILHVCHILQLSLQLSNLIL